MNKPEQQPQPADPSRPAVGNVLQVDRRTAAKMLGYSPATFDRLRKRGLIKANVATGRPRFTMKELERFIEKSSE